MADSPFIGPTYPLKAKSTSIARTINMMPVRQDPGNDRSTWVFKDVPGLVDANQSSPATYYTSWLYPVFADDAFNADRARPIAGQLWVQPLEAFNADRPVPQSGTLLDQLHTYDQPESAFNADRPVPQSGTLLDQLHTYDQPESAFNADRSTPLSGTLVVQLITYDQPESAFNADRPTPLSGTLA